MSLCPQAVSHAAAGIAGPAVKLAVLLWSAAQAEAAAAASIMPRPGAAPWRGTGRTWAAPS